MLLAGRRLQQQWISMSPAVTLVLRNVTSQCLLLWEWWPLMMDESRIQLIGWSRAALWRNLHRLWLFILINSSEGFFLCGLRPALHWLTAKCREIQSQILTHSGVVASVLYTRVSQTQQQWHLGLKQSLLFRLSCVYCWMFSSILVFHPPDAANTPAPRNSYLSKLTTSADLASSSQLSKVAPSWERAARTLLGTSHRLLLLNTTHVSQPGIRPSTASWGSEFQAHHFSVILSNEETPKSRFRKPFISSPWGWHISSLLAPEPRIRNYSIPSAKQQYK